VSMRLAEVAEADARDGVAAAYADIRATLGLPVVNLVYRHLAGAPGRLEAVWADVAPALRDPATEPLVTEVAAAAVPAPEVCVIPATALAAAGVDAPVLRGLAHTLDAYDRGNGVNLLAISALLHGADGAARPGAAGATPPAAHGAGGNGAVASALPPMADPETLDPAARALVEEMSEAVSGPARPLLIPSLFRHLARPPALLPLAWTVLRGPLGTAAFTAAAERVAAAARAAAAHLPAGVPRADDPATRAALDRFRGAVPRMLVVSAMLRAAFAEGLPAAGAPEGRG
jgi:hypothetical protein